MKFKKIISALMVAVLMASSAFAAEGRSGETGREIKSVTRLDSKNVMIMWEGDGSGYDVYRAGTEAGNYSFIGTSNGSSFRDEHASAENSYFYKIIPANAQNRDAFSKPVAIGTNPQTIDSVPVIMYHHFVTKQDIENGVEFGEYSLLLEDFEKDLKYLRSNGYITITSDDLLEYLHGKKPLPQKAVILSIDDGSWGVYKNAYPMLQKYNCKADFNIIGERVDEMEQLLRDGGTRQGLGAPYCTWVELKELGESGVINICSHTYGEHHYSNTGGRKGIRKMDEESEEEYIQLVKEDFNLVTQSLTARTNIVPRTLAYPYSRRNSFSDKALLEYTAYELLMGGEGARGTENNYFVRGADYDSQIKLMSRPCRKTGTPISAYLDNVYKTDFANGVGQEYDPKHINEEECQNIASYYSAFSDVDTGSWYSSAVYYTYLNGLLSGTTESKFSPDANINHAMTSVVLYHMAGSPAVSGAENIWYGAAMKWAETNAILPADSDPEAEISREDLAQALFNYAKYTGERDLPEPYSLNGFKDAADISQNAIEAVEWAVANNLMQGNEDNCLTPHSSVTRAQLAVILQSWNISH